MKPDKVLVLVDVFRLSDWDVAKDEESQKAALELEEKSRRIESLAKEIAHDPQWTIYATTYRQCGSSLYGDLEAIIPKGNIIVKNSYGSFELVERICTDHICRGILPYEIVFAGFLFSKCVLANAILCNSRFTQSRISIAENLTWDNPGIADKAQSIALGQGIAVLSYDFLGKPALPPLQAPSLI